MLEPEEHEALGTSARCAIRVFSGCSRNPRVSRTAATSSRACFGLLAGGAKDHQIICVLHQHPVPPPATRPRLIEDVQSDVCEQR